MEKSELFSSLSSIVFANKDPDTITQEIISLYEQSAERTLSRADPVRLFLNAVILVVIQQRALIDFAAKQNLLAYSSGSCLDHLGALLGVTRLTAAHSGCSVRFTLGHYYSFDIVIPSGTRITPNGIIYFATTQALAIKAGELTGITDAVCLTAGEAGNDFVAGQINKLVDVLAYDLSVENVNTSSGGSEIESDEAFRERIHIAPESFSCAGPVKSYEYYARSANSDIIDVAVVGPPDIEPGHVDIYPLMAGGTFPNEPVLAAVLEACNDERVRPDTDYVSVKCPKAVDYEIDLTYWIDEGNAGTSSVIKTSIEAAVDEYVLWQRKALGRDVNPSELIHRVIKAGAKRCEVRKPEFVRLSAYESAQCVRENVVYGGLEEA